MQRRLFLASLAGATASVAGCNTTVFAASDSVDVYNPTGQASIRPIDDPYIQQGLTSESEQYLFARLFRSGDCLPVTDTPGAAAYADAIAALTDSQFAVLTLLRTASAAPAHFWPTDTHWSDGRLIVELGRQSTSSEVAGNEAVGVAVTTYDVDGELPAGADVVFPSGATMSVGTQRG